ncbi:MAG: uncharacterized protein PWQ77_1826 [Kosmotogales bacterium]|nr:uncharacterized protein [Kosmotogales bacterium]
MGGSNIKKYSDISESFIPLDSLFEIYSELDLKIENIINVSGLNCLPTCRYCCTTHSKNIEASLFEMLPLSIRLWQFGEAESWLKKATLSDGDSKCILLEEDVSVKPEGGCKFYSYRPLLCRLFGFSGKKDKNDKTQFSSCKLVKKMNPQFEIAVKRYIDSGNTIPVYSEFSQKVAGLNPYLADKKYPINIAFKKALEYTGYRWDIITRNIKKTV